ncbi:hypothetical protein EGT07_23590 [Herbaspirillum sp. HC18]|nr:hypothetical protein EGT07_23590 [Herbaspirillum sp. HC18]
MFFGGRWVPMEVMHTIFLLWVIAVLLVGVAWYWLIRSRRPTTTRQSAPPETGRSKWKKRKRH